MSVPYATRTEMTLRFQRAEAFATAGYAASGVLRPRKVAGTRRDVELLGIVVLTALVHLTSFQKGHPWGDDGSAYIHQAKSLVEGSVPQLLSMAAYRFENSTTEVMVGPPLYPWGFPILLSPAIALFGLELLPMKTLILAFALGAQALTFFLLRRRVSDRWAMLIAFTSAMNPVFFRFKEDILSDIPFLFFTFLSLLLMQRIVIEGRRCLGPTLDPLMLGQAVSCAILVRTHGLALVATLAAVQLGQVWSGRGAASTGTARSLRDRVQLSSMIPYAVVAIECLLAKALLSGGESQYLASGHFAYDGPGEIVAIAAYNVAYYADLPSRFLHPSPLGRGLHFLVFVPLAFIGARRRLGRDYLLLVFAAFFMAVLLVFPFHQGVRFIIPVMPLYFHFALAGALEAQAPLARRWPSLGRLPGLPVLVFAPTVAGFVLSVLVDWTRLATHPRTVMEGPHTPTSIETFDHIRRRTDHDAVITFWKPRALMLYAGRRSVLNVQPEMILGGRADHLLVYNGSALARENPRRINESMQDAVRIRPERFRLVFRNRDFLLYRILPDGARPPRTTRRPSRAAGRRRRCSARAP